jgi:hypothetical protein
MPADEPSSHALDVLFAHALANQAVDHPEWGYDQHVTRLMTKGFSNELIVTNARAIHEAMHFANELLESGRITK